MDYCILNFWLRKIKRKELTFICELFLFHYIYI
jgi:hypothetical protein